MRHKSKAGKRFIKKARLEARLTNKVSLPSKQEVYQEIELNEEDENLLEDYGDSFAFLSKLKPADLDKYFSFDLGNQRN